LADESASTISWIGTISSYLLIVVGIISGPLFDLGFYKVMLFGGALVSCFGIFMLSLSRQYYQIILTQGVLIGLGCGVLFIPGMALVSRSFTRRRAVALGAISCGAPFGMSKIVSERFDADHLNRRHNIHGCLSEPHQLRGLRLDCAHNGFHYARFILDRVSPAALEEYESW
jgi:hypothetical protein